MSSSGTSTVLSYLMAMGDWYFPLQVLGQRPYFWKLHSSFKGTTEASLMKVGSAPLLLKWSVKMKSLKICLKLNKTVSA